MEFIFRLEDVEVRRMRLPAQCVQDDVSHTLELRVCLVGDSAAVADVCKGADSVAVCRRLPVEELQRDDPDSVHVEGLCDCPVGELGDAPARRPVRKVFQLVHIAEALVDDPQVLLGAVEGQLLAREYREALEVVKPVKVVAVRVCEADCVKPRDVLSQKLLP